MWMFIGEDFCKEDRKAVFRKKDSKSPFNNIELTLLESKINNIKSLISAPEILIHVNA
jgi:hypothetical protein